MESSRFCSEAKGFVLSNEMVSSPTDVPERSREILMAGNLKNQRFMELGSSEIKEKPLSCNPFGGLWGSEISYDRVVSGEDDSNCQESSLIDLKLGMMADCRDAQNDKSSKEMLVLSSTTSRIPSKKARTKAPFCQINGCNGDLSSSKDYNKRHKVCEMHSKSAKVTVNGVEQRFCQQCSRFHLLAEFDDGKRSCRKRLARHNERRRKPQLDNYSLKNRQLLHFYHGSRFLEPSLPTQSSLGCPDIFPSGIPHSVKGETSSWWRSLKSEDEAVHSPQSAIPLSDGHSFAKSFAPLCSLEKQYPFHDNGFGTAPGFISYESNVYCPHDLAGSNSIPQLMSQDTSSGSEAFSVFDTASTVQGSRVLDSSCALSLLSSQSLNSSSQSSKIPVARQLITRAGQVDYSVDRFHETLLGVKSQASVDYNMEPILISNTCNDVDFEVQTDGFLQGAGIMNTKDPLFHEHATIDLLQLSSQLDRVERQKHSP